MIIHNFLWDPLRAELLPHADQGMGNLRGNFVHTVKSLYVAALLYLVNVLILL